MIWIGSVSKIDSIWFNSIQIWLIKIWIEFELKDLTRFLIQIEFELKSVRFDSV